ncbi:unnamed protein product [Rotaria sp. Silwood1]|nr:unnamed protein product [Rotaria sp. Silwood1]CAF1599890.1 unnamed protein product [Rotaria sp. Silwood1]CAF3735997.1 unnamed protein product [Rotaria sp. Silwood1]CAF4755003.1 unnamed protein product [Rotaria sp. Silwood1]
MFLPIVGAVALAIDAAFRGNRRSPSPQQSTITTSLRTQINEMREEIENKRRDLEKYEKKARRKNMKSFDDVAKYEKRRQKALSKLAHKTKTIKRQGNNIGIFGLTSTGKSTIVNSLLGKNVAETGVGETTKEITSYHGTGYTLWDTPGRNDELTYSNEKYISFIKGLTRRLILIQYTIKENLNLIRLFDDLELGYDIIVNKFDEIDEDEQSKFQCQIQREIESFGLKRKKNVFFISAKYPRMFPSWLEMVDYLTNECVDYDNSITTDTDSDTSSSSDSNSDSSSGLNSDTDDDS